MIIIQYRVVVSKIFNGFENFGHETGVSLGRSTLGSLVCRLATGTVDVRQPQLEAFTARVGVGPQELSDLPQDIPILVAVALAGLVRAFDARIGVSECGTDESLQFVTVDTSDFTANVTDARGQCCDCEVGNCR